MSEENYLDQGDRHEFLEKIVELEKKLDDIGKSISVVNQKRKSEISELKEQVRHRQSYLNNLYNSNPIRRIVEIEEVLRELYISIDKYYSKGGDVYEFLEELRLNLKKLEGGKNNGTI